MTDRVAVAAGLKTNPTSIFDRQIELTKSDLFDASPHQVGTDWAENAWNAFNWTDSKGNVKLGIDALERVPKDAERMITGTRDLFKGTFLSARDAGGYLSHLIRFEHTQALEQLDQQYTHAHGDRLAANQAELTARARLETARANPNAAATRQLEAEVDKLARISLNLSAKEDALQGMRDNLAGMKEGWALMKKGTEDLVKGGLLLPTDITLGLVGVAAGVPAAGVGYVAGFVLESVREGTEVVFGGLAVGLQGLSNALDAREVDANGRWIGEAGVRMDPLGLISAGKARYGEAGRHFDVAFGDDYPVFSKAWAGMVQAGKGLGVGAAELSVIAAHAALGTVTFEWVTVFDAQIDNRRAQLRDAETRGDTQRAAELRTDIKILVEQGFHYRKAAALWRSLDPQIQRNIVEGFQKMGVAAENAGIHIAHFSAGIWDGLVGTGAFAAGGLLVGADAVREGLEDTLQLAAHGAAAVHNLVANEKQDAVRREAIRAGTF